MVHDTYGVCDVNSLGYTNPFGEAGAAGNSFAYPESFHGDPRTLPTTANPSVEGGMYISAGDYARHSGDRPSYLGRGLPCFSERIEAHRLVGGACPPVVVVGHRHG